MSLEVSLEAEMLNREFVHQGAGFHALELHGLICIACIF